jgi:hypothetical protein
MAEVERIELALTLAPIETPDGALVRPSGAILTSMPAGAVPSAGFPYDDGEWLLNQSDLDGLTISLPKAGLREFRPNIVAFYEDSEGGINTCDATDFEAVPLEAAGIGVVAVGPGVPLDLSVAVNGLGPGDQVYDLTVTGLPAGAKLSAGFDNGDGSWTLMPDEIHAVSLIVPDDFAGPLTLAYPAVGVGPQGEVHSHNAAADFWLEARAIPPKEAVSDAVAARPNGLPPPPVRRWCSTSRR